MNRRDIFIIFGLSILAGLVLAATATVITELALGVFW